MKEISIQTKREIASEFATLMVDYITQGKHVLGIIHTMDKCQKERGCYCASCDKYNDCGLYRAWQSGLHKHNTTESNLCLFMRSNTRTFLHLLDARAVETSALLDILVKEELEYLGYISSETRVLLQNIGYDSSLIK